MDGNGAHAAESASDTLTANPRKDALSAETSSEAVGEEGSGRKGQASSQPNNNLVIWPASALGL